MLLGHLTQAVGLLVPGFAVAAAGCHPARLGDADQVSLVQHQLKVVNTDPSLTFGVEAAREVIAFPVSEVIFDDDENLVPLQEQVNISCISCNGAHIKSLASRGRWFGWKHPRNEKQQQAKLHPSEVDPKPNNGDEGLNFFKAAPPGEWVILGAVCVISCILDTFVMQRLPKLFHWHLAVIVFWMAVAVLYVWALTARMGRQKGVEWISGYVLEWMLSMDNLFVFHLVFRTYKTPPNQVHKAVFVGIIGAVVMRLIFFMVVSTLLRAFGWFRWPFGLLLVWSGVQAIRGEDEDDAAVEDTFLIRQLKKCLGSRILDTYSETGAHLFVFEKNTGRLQISVLLIVILVIEFSDIVFALDSVSAKVAQIPNQYIAFSSSVLAMYGLRAMFFIVEDLVKMFGLLNYGLGLILVFIGVELMFGRWIKLSSGIECILIVSVFVFCMIASAVKSAIWPEEDEDKESSESVESTAEPDKLSNRSESESVRSAPCKALEN